MPLSPHIQKLKSGKNLTQEEMKSSVEYMLREANAEQVKTLLTLLHEKGETVDEISGAIAAMKNYAVHLDPGMPVMDIVGTGGDGANTVNISTGSALLSAACGAKVAKHGNRASSSKCGSADVLEALGFAIDLGPDEVTRSIEETGFGFLFAPHYHPGMMALRAVRKSMNIRTIFNLIGPLINPASPQFYVMGVYTKKLLQPFADVLNEMGVEHAFVVHGDGLDEISPTGEADLIEVASGETVKTHLNPEDYGFDRCPLSALQSSSVRENVKHLEDALGGKQGPIADAILLNTGVALATCEIAKSFEEGFEIARDHQKRGAGADLLDRAMTLSQKLKGQG